MNHELSNLMNIEKPVSMPVCCPLDPSNTNRAQDFFSYWKQGAALIGRGAFPMLPKHPATWADVQLASMPHLLKALHALDVPRRTLLLTMVCLANPGFATWMQREHGLHYGHMNACHLGSEIFQIVVGLLANHQEIQKTEKGAAR
ncbi:hypothetical protein OE470_06755 [Pseudomonas aeruginosa]|nr:hypothetical protein [Pseudomonas aeruginosa]MCU9088383.1 hypothetical protein [Pseudomonas aeruginosa]